ncbi:MAG TPA: serine/threonine-protein kinase [Thermoanaerobaculia bacterium]|nr:serine/threonine-protein kinase [Thermoanaerobaculia bacterium]
MLPLSPTKLGRYEIVDEIGKGAMGVVYLARDPLIGRLVALKTFRIGYSVKDDDLEQFRARFIREAQSAGILSHPNIVTIHDVVERSDEGLAFIAMEYVRGTNLKSVLQEEKRPTLPYISDIVGQIAEGLDYAHSCKVIHRDIKPANILITSENRVKITDFGIARLDTSNLTQEGQLLGTPNYMSPEQILGREVDHRADIFSLGVVFYEMVTRHKPFQGDNLTVVSHRIVYDQFTSPSVYIDDLPPGVEQILGRALEKDPLRRYARARELADDLRRVVGSIGARDVLNETQSLSSTAVLPAGAAPAAAAAVAAAAGRPSAAPPPLSLPARATGGDPATVPMPVPVGGAAGGRSPWLRLLGRRGRAGGAAGSRAPTAPAAPAPAAVLRPVAALTPLPPSPSSLPGSPERSPLAATMPAYSPPPAATAPPPLAAPAPPPPPTSPTLPTMSSPDRAPAAVPGQRAAAFRHATRPAAPPPLPPTPPPPLDTALADSSPAPAAPPIAPAPLAPLAPDAAVKAKPASASRPRPPRLLLVAALAAAVALMLGLGVLLALRLGAVRDLLSGVRGGTALPSTSAGAPGRVAGAARAGSAIDQESARQRMLFLLREGRRLQDAGDPDGALAAYRAAEQLDPGHQSLRRLRADAERQQAERRRRVGQEREIEARLTAGRQALAERRYDDAESAAAAVLQVSPGNTVAQDILAAVRDGRARHKERAGSSPAARAAAARAAEAAAAAHPEPAPGAPGTAGAARADAPQAVSPEVKEATLDLAFFTQLPEGTLMVYINGNKVLQEPFRFYERGNLFRAKPSTGWIRRSLHLPAGSAQLRVYVTAQGRAAEVRSLSGNFPGGASRRLDVQLSAGGDVTATLN